VLRVVGVMAELSEELLEPLLDRLPRLRAGGVMGDGDAHETLLESLASADPPR
jgi:hypothetical protein